MARLPKPGRKFTLLGLILIGMALVRRADNKARLAGRPTLTSRARVAATAGRLAVRNRTSAVQLHNEDAEERDKA